MSEFVLSKDLDWVSFGRRVALLYPVSHALGLVGLLLQGQPKSIILAWLVVDVLLLTGVILRKRFVAPMLLVHAMVFPFLSADIGEMFLWNLFLTPSSTLIFAAIGAWGIWSVPRKGVEMPRAISDCLLSAMIFAIIAVQGVHHAWVEQGMRGTEFLAAVFVSIALLFVALWMARASRVAIVLGWAMLFGGMIFAAQEGGWIDWAWLLMSSTLWCLAYLAVVGVRGAFSVRRRLAVEHYPRPFVTGISRYAGRGLAAALVMVLAMRFVVESPSQVDQMAGVGDVVSDTVLADDDGDDGLPTKIDGLAAVDKKEKPKSRGEHSTRKPATIPELKAIERAGMGIR